MQNKIWTKGVVIGIILLFFGASIVPIIKADPITWDVTLIFTNPGGQNDYTMFGEAPDANDGPPVDIHDVAKPPAPMPPYIRAYLKDGLPAPYTNLWKDYRQYPDSAKVWNLSVLWYPEDEVSPTTITMSWSTAEVDESEYTTVNLCTNAGVILKNMLVNNTYTFTCPALVPQNFKIICSTNQPPNTPNNPTPQDTATNVPLDTQLGWSGGDPDPGDTVSYDVYFGTTNPPVKIVSNQSATTYNPGTLVYNTQYFWKIIAWDNYGASTEGPFWSFTTEQSSSVWLYHKMITIDHTKVAEILTDFPVLIRLTNDNNLSSHAQPNGNDIRFTDDQGTQLNHEIESYNSSTGTLVAWVKIPTLSSTTDTILFMYYGNSGASNQQNSEGTWNTHFLAVHHLEETTGTIYDSTSYNNDGTPFGDLNENILGRINGADYFDGANDHITLPQVFTNENQFTMEAWIYPEVGARYFVSQRVSPDTGVFIQLIEGGSDLQYYINGVKDSISGILLNTWYYVVLTYDGTTAKLYVNDGTPRSKTCSMPIWPVDGMCIGDRLAGNRQFHGILDEIRFSNVARDTGWITTVYNNENNPSTFYSVGSEEIIVEAPIISNEMPNNGSTQIPISLFALNFTLFDMQFNLMNYSITTTPDIIGGTQTGSNVISGTTIHIPIIGGLLVYDTLYTWNVHVTDGYHWTNNTYMFTTEQSPSAWLYHKMITIDHTKVAEILTDFPVLIRLTNDNNLSSHAQPNGNDIRFTDDQGTQLNHEIESYNSSTGTLVAWVKIPTLSSTTDTILFMYYGNSGASNQQNSEGTWNTHFLAVHHLEETTGTIYDSTSYNNDGTPFGDLNENILGRINGADYFDGANDHITLPQVFTNENQFTMEAWIYPEVGARYFVSQRVSPDTGVFIQLIEGGSDLQYYINGVKDSISGILLNTWYYVVLTYDGTTAKLYVNDGTPRSKTCSMPIWPVDGMCIGDRLAGNRQFHGILDEIRFSNVARDTGWITTVYNNENNPSSFFSISNEESG